MKIEDLDVFKNESLSPMEKAKLKIVTAFYDRLPTKEMKMAFLELIAGQPLMAPGEFDARLDDFAARVKSEERSTQGLISVAGPNLSRLH